MITDDLRPPTATARLVPASRSLRGVWLCDVFIGPFPLIKIMLGLQLATLIAVCVR